MAFTDITSITAPSSAVAGERVDITVKIKNLYSSAIGIMVGGALEYGATPWPQITYPTDWANVAAGATQSFSGYFTMPSASVKIHAYSYYYGTDGFWHFEDELTKNVSIVYEWVMLGSVTNLSLTPGETPEEGWVLLGSVTNLSLTAGLAPEEWHELGSITNLAVTPLAAGGWILLGQVTDLLLTPMGVEPPTCTPGDTKCIGVDLYRCSPDGEWVLDEENSSQCPAGGEGEFPWLLVAGGLGLGAVILAASGKKKPKAGIKKP